MKYDERELVVYSFNNFPKQNDNEKYSRYTSEAAVVAQRFERTLRNLLNKTVFQAKDADWVSQQLMSLKS